MSTESNENEADDSTPLAPTLAATPGAPPSGPQRTDGPQAPVDPPYTVDWAKIARETVVQPGSKVHLHHGAYNASYVDSDLGKDKGTAAIQAAKAEFFSWQDKFYAQADRAMLIVIQGIDAAGKDSTIKAVMSGCTPEGVDVYGFKQPSAKELGHDYLWRHNLVLPELGSIAIFNRSHYENILTTRVHPEVLWPKTAVPEPKHIWRQRYRQINDWERYLTENGTTIVKLFLHVSREEQGKRFLERVDDPAKNWKVSPSDMVERGFWPQYNEAFTKMLEHTSTSWAPWHVIPCDEKWFSHVSSFGVLLETMRQLAPSYPTVDAKLEAIIANEKKELLAGK